MHGEVKLDHFHNPRNMGALEAPDAVGREGVPGQGNSMALYLRVDGQQVCEATFETYGCTSALACGSYLTEWLKGKPMSEAKQFDWEALAMELDLPLGKEHCAQLAIGALREALRQLTRKRGEC